MRCKWLYIVPLFLAWSCTNPSEKENTKEDTGDQLETLNDSTTYSLSISAIEDGSELIDTSEHFRGLQISSTNAIIGGSNGNVLSYSFSSSEISLLSSNENRHLRDIDILENGNIITLAITEPAEILLKTAGSDNFVAVYSPEDTLAFLDGVDFWNNMNGLAFGDPLDDYPYILYTIDGGITWFRVDRDAFPEEALSYAGFAASGTSLSCLNDGVAVIGLGNETAKVLRTEDFGKNWNLIDVPYHNQPEGSGIYSLSFMDNLNGTAVGGHWQNITCDSSKLYTTDGGKSWQLAAGMQEYRSCVTYFKNNIFIASGTTGTDISYDGGKTWELLDSTGYNAVVFREDGSGIGVSSYGTIEALMLIENH